MSAHQKQLTDYATEERKANSKLVVQDYTVTFYVDSVKPDMLPNFPYSVTGSAAGRVKMVAYVSAADPSDARYAVGSFFPDSYVESVEPGRIAPAAPTIHGMAVPERSAGLLTRIIRSLF